MRNAERGASQIPLVICIVLLLVASFFAYTQYSDRESAEARLNGILEAAKNPAALNPGDGDVKALIAFAHHIVLYVIGVALALVPLGWTSLLAIPGIVLLFVNGFWLVGALAFLGARFRDVELIVRNLLQLAFFFTPVFWNHEVIPTTRRYIVDYNPFYYLIEIIRSPLLGKIPEPKEYVVVLLVTVMGYIVTVAVYLRMRRRLAFYA